MACFPATNNTYSSHLAALEEDWSFYNFWFTSPSEHIVEAHSKLLALLGIVVLFSPPLLSISRRNAPRPPVSRSSTSSGNRSIASQACLFSYTLSSSHLPDSTQSQPTMSSTEGPLFSSELISPEVLKALPEGYSCRPLERKDYHNGFLDVLRVLTTVGDITEEVRNPLFSLEYAHESPRVPGPSQTCVKRITNILSSNGTNVTTG